MSVITEGWVPRPAAPMTPGTGLAPEAESPHEGSCSLMSVPTHAAGILRMLECKGCGRRIERGSSDACTWWPKGCRTVWGDPKPQRCWDCCNQNQRLDLADAGCRTAATLLRTGR